MENMARPLSKEKRSYTIQVRGYNAIKKTREYLKILGAYRAEISLFENCPLDLIQFSTNNIIHEHEIAIFATLLAVVNLIFGIIAIAGLYAQISLLHDIEVQLTAHGVDWALYTPAP